MDRRTPTADSGADATTPGGRPARFGDYDSLAQAHTWDAGTRETVLSRTGPPPRPRFFTPEEGPVADALFDRLLAQDREPRVPVTRMVGERLAAGETDGWRYEDMPEDGDAWRRTLKALDDDARSRFGAGFASVDRVGQRELIQAVQDLSGKAWHGMPAQHVWSLWTRYACTAFYSHPWAWNEIGFGGPAYPRGYLRLGVGLREPWERPDSRPDDPVDRAPTGGPEAAPETREGIPGSARFNSSSQEGNNA